LNNRRKKREIIALYVTIITLLTDV